MKTQHMPAQIAVLLIAGTAPTAEAPAPPALQSHWDKLDVLSAAAQELAWLWLRICLPESWSDRPQVRKLANVLAALALAIWMLVYVATVLVVLNIT